MPFSHANISLLSSSRSQHPQLHCSPSVTLNGCTVLLLTPAPEQECQAARGWWGENILQDVFNISVALARNELEMPVLQWLELDGSVLGEIA